MQSFIIILFYVFVPLGLILVKLKVANERQLLFDIICTFTLLYLISATEVFVKCLCFMFIERFYMFKCLCILMHCVVVLTMFTGLKCTTMHHLPEPSN